ncbi:hypothetical protein A3Q56_03579 [Intoshia linei]|uniref:Mothers against decapentaplegic homolog n=1 Tax=Intoshia linei TaxID=1819745 RepID=A0A177B3C0_9BILA|nr:hypothetical protein A3Q56_03579 [Intoshia linei]
MAPLSDIFKFMGNSTIIKRLLSMQIATPTNYKNTEFANSLPIEPIDPRVIKAFYTFLLKKLINPSETLVELEKVLMGKYSTKSPCILYKRESLDGKIVVNGLLLSPFFVSCKIWQWPLLVTEKEIDPIRTCSNSHFKSSADVCINPYHYEKIKISTLTVHVPKKSNATNKIIESNDSFNPYVPTLHHQSNINVDDNPIHLKKHTFSQSSDQNQQVDQFNLNHFSSPITFDEPMYWCSISYYEYSERVGETFQASLPAFDVDGFTYPSNAQRFCLVSNKENLLRNNRELAKTLALAHQNNNILKQTALNLVNGRMNSRIQYNNFRKTKVGEIKEFTKDLKKFKIKLIKDITTVFTDMEIRLQQIKGSIESEYDTNSFNHSDDNLSSQQPIEESRFSSFTNSFCDMDLLSIGELPKTIDNVYVKSENNICQLIKEESPQRIILPSKLIDSNGDKSPIIDDVFIMRLNSPISFKNTKKKKRRRSTLMKIESKLDQPYCQSEKDNTSILKLKNNISESVEKIKKVDCVNNVKKIDNCKTIQKNNNNIQSDTNTDSKKLNPRSLRHGNNINYKEPKINGKYRSNEYKSKKSKPPKKK